MKTSEIWTAFLFVAAIGSVFFLEWRWLRHAWVQRSPGPFWPVQNLRVHRSLIWILNFISITGAACILYGFFVEPAWIETTFIEIRSPKIKRGSGRIRLVQISDLHSKRRGANELKAAGIINSLQPDLVLLTGDYVNSEEGKTVFREMINSLQAPFGILLVQSLEDTRVKDLLQGLPVTLLNKNNKKMEIRGTPFIVAGMEDGEETRLEATLKPLSQAASGEAYNIFLFHHPDLIEEASRFDVDLYLAGHLHGGQVRLPFYGALITLARYGKRFEAGLYQVGRTALYVNRGLGTNPLPARFLCRPEITVIDLISG